MTPVAPAWLSDPPPGSHAVLLSHDSATLEAGLRLYAGSGLARGEGVLMVASASTRQTLFRSLATDGFDVPALRRSGRLELLGAERTLPRLMAGRLPDRRRFEAVVGGALRRATARHSSLRVFGDMVEALRRQRNLKGAVRLEEMWGELLAGGTVPLLCHYRVDCLDPAAYRGTFQAIACVHSHLLPTADPARFATAVDQALAEMLGPPGSRIRTWLRGAARRDGRRLASMPEAEVVLLRLCENLPVLGDRLLSRVRALSRAQSRRPLRPRALVERDAVDALQRVIVDELDAQRTVERSRDELRALSSRLLTLGEDERAAVAGDLHGVLGQTLAAAKIDVALARRRLDDPAAASSAGTRERLDEAEARLDQGIRAVRELATRLRPAILDVVGLSAASQWLAREFQTRTGIACAFRDAGPDRAHTSRPAVAATAFRILEEALKKLARLPRVGRVWVRLGGSDTQLTLGIRADMAPTRSRPRGDPLRTVAMRERARMLGGTLEARHSRDRIVLRLRLPRTPPGLPCPAPDVRTRA